MLIWQHDWFATDNYGFKSHRVHLLKFIFNIFIIYYMDLKKKIKQYSGGCTRGFIFPDGEVTYIIPLHQKMAQIINPKYKSIDLEKLGLVRFGFLSFLYIESFKIPNTLQFESLANIIVSRKIKNVHLNIIEDNIEKSVKFARNLNKETLTIIVLFINSDDTDININTITLNTRL